MQLGQSRTDGPVHVAQNKNPNRSICGSNINLQLTGELTDITCEHCIRSHSGKIWAAHWKLVSSAIDALNHAQLHEVGKAVDEVNRQALAMSEKVEILSRMDW
jgi:hypothetical protein